MILYRYIVREHVLPFLYALAVIIFMLLMQLAVQLLDKIISKGLDPRVVIELFLIQLGWIVALAVPMAILVATLMAFGQMSADNEITAIKASGRNLFHLLTPVLISGLIMTVLLVYFNNLILPDANHRLANLSSDISRKRPAAFIEPGVLIRDFPDYALYVQRVNASSGLLHEVKIFSDVRGQDPTSTTADSGHLCMTSDGQYLQLTLFCGESHSIRPTGEHYVARFDTQVVIIKNVDSQFRRTSSSYRGDREKTVEMMLADIAQSRQRRDRYLAECSAASDSLATLMKRTGDSAITAAAASSPTGRLPPWARRLFPRVLSPDQVRAGQAVMTTFEAWAKRAGPTGSKLVEPMVPLSQTIGRLARQIRTEETEINQYLVEVHKKFAIPVTCLVFILIGAPLGIMARRGGMAAGVSYSIFFFLLFWACYIGGENLADKGIIPAWIAMWSGNIIVGVGGVFFIAQMIRERTVLSLQPVYGFFVRAISLVGAHRRSGSAGHGSPFRRIVSMVAGAPFQMFRPVARTLPLHLLRSFFANIIGVLIGLIVIFAVLDYISNMRKFEHASFFQVVRYYWYYIPWFINSFLAIVILLACMFSVGSMAKHSELTAMRGAGISLWQLSVPLLVVGVALAALGFYFGESVLPKANAKRKDLEERFEAQRLPAGRQPVVAAGSGETRRNFYYFASHRHLYFFKEFGVNPVRSRGVWRTTFDGHRVVERVQAESLDWKNKSWYFEKAQIRRFSGDFSTVTSRDTLRDSVLVALPGDMVARVKVKEEMSYWELQSCIMKLRAQGEKVQTYMADLHFKIALPLMNFIVILLGVSITARTGRKGGAVLFGIGLVIVFAYYILSRFLLAFGESGQLSPILGAWLGNVLFFMIGGGLFLRAVR